mmetsp:Transcript_5726/g.15246  ORF Transcript_5726/g.15246 Transcript_5726/m.15246 type:complete len:232 (+) Transcript_5726:48-743(+)
MRKASTAQQGMLPMPRCLLLLLVAATANGRATKLSSAISVPERIQKMGDTQRAMLQNLINRVMQRGSVEHETAQPDFAGTWHTTLTEGMDEYLDRAMGVGYLKRKIALKASQSQTLWQEGNIVHLEMTDKRGTVKFIIRPDGRTYPGKGFMKLPMKQRARWDKKTLVIDERYAQHFGGEEHGKPASGEQCPVICSRRFVDKSGKMVVQVERQLLSGETIGMKTFYKRTASE